MPGRREKHRRQLPCGRAESPEISVNSREPMSRCAAGGRAAVARWWAKSRHGLRAYEAREVVASAQLTQPPRPLRTHRGKQGDHADASRPNSAGVFDDACARRPGPRAPEERGQGREGSHTKRAAWRAV